MPTLIKTTNELKQFVTVSTGLEIATLNPFLTNSEAEREIIRVCGQAVYSDLMVAYNATPQTLTPAQVALLPYVQKPLANLALYFYVQQSGVIISSSGITLAQDREKQAYQWQQIKLEQAIINTGYYALDTLISYLFAHEADFPEWKNTSEYYQNRNFFINTPQEFSKWVNIKANYRTLVALRPFMRQIEYSYLKNALGTELFNEIKAQILTIGAPEGDTLRFYVDENGNLAVDSEEGQEFNVDQNGQLYLTYINMTPEVKDLLADYIQPAVAHLSIARAIKELNFNITADGAFLQGIKAQSAANIQEVNGPDAEQRDQYSALHQQEGMDWLSKMSAFLNAEASAEKYPEYFNSSLYVAPEDVVQGWKPEDDSKIWY
jgi:hypothetical protein